MNATRSFSSQLNQVKKNLRRRLTQEFQDRLPVAVIRRAVDEADQIAHGTGFPQLVFPLLAEEIVHRVSGFMSDAHAASSAFSSLAA